LKALHKLYKKKSSLQGTKGQSKPRRRRC